MRSKGHHKATSSQTDQKGKSRHSLTQLQDKLAALAPGMNRGVQFFTVLEEAVRRGPIALQIPETLIRTSRGEYVFLLTESDGFVRVIRSDTNVSDFLMTCSVKNCAMRNRNPQGVKYPKFVTFRQGILEFTLRRVAEAKRYIREGDGEVRIQRYVMPYEYSVSKTLIHWRRVKQARAYCLSSRDTISTQRKQIACFSPGSDHITPYLSKSEGNSSEFSHISAQNFTLDLSFLASTHNIRSCSISKSSRIPDFHSYLISLLRRELEAWVLQPCEQLEEFLFHVIQSQDGLWYVLDLPCAKVSMQDSPNSQSLHLRSLSLELSTDYSEASKGRNVGSEVSPPKRHNTDISEQYMAKHIAEMSELIDELRTESRKEGSGVLKRVRFERYPRELLPRLIHHVYTHILQDSRLSRYYPDKSRVLTKLESSIRQVFLHGCSRFIKAKVLAIHAHMRIANRDFDLYIGYFGEAMRREGVSTEDEEAIREFLQGFRQYVVQ